LKPGQPALSQAREKARQAVCMSNLKQIGLAMAMYTQDWDEYFVPWGWEDGSYHDHNLWPEVLKNSGYLKYTQISKAKVYQCPSLRLKVGSASTIHYGYNYYHIGSSYRYTQPQNEFSPPAKLSQIKKPSETILLVDAYGYSSFFSSWVGRYIAVDSYISNPLDNVPHARHSNGLNVCWVDGHVSYVKIADPNNPWRELGDAEGKGGNPKDPKYWDRY